MTDETVGIDIAAGGREDDGDDLRLVGVEMEEDHKLLWDDINPPPEDLVLYLHMDGPDSSFTSSSSSSSSSTAVPPTNSSPPFADSLSIGQVEEFLLNDDHSYSHDPSKIEDFLSDILLDSPLPLTDHYYPSSSTSSDDNNDDNNHNNLYRSQSQSPPEIVSLQDQPNHPEFPNAAYDSSPPTPCDPKQNSPLSQNSQPQSQAKDSSEPQELGQPGPPLSEHCQPNHDDDDAGDDPITKKRKRQLRNRDAAVRSRERKKMYVRDLELKSRHYESECRRLGMLLQCYLAENHALRLSLHDNSQAFAASTTKQESAVLLLESLLLGSLLWFLGVIGLLILPRQLLSILEAAQMEVGKNLGRLAPREAGSNVDGTLEFHQSYMMSKRCRGSRRKMRCYVVVALQKLGDASVLSCG